MRCLFATAFVLGLCVCLAADVNDLHTGLTEVGSGDHPTQFGLLKLPRVSMSDPPAECKDFAHACALEKAGRYNEAIQFYEQRMETCGLAGWKKLGHLGKGVRVTMSLWRTPCGLQVALKSTHASTLVVSHISVDCLILEKLSHHLDDERCKGCFPRFYHLSNVTGACYSERITGLTTNLFLNHVDKEKPDGVRLVKNLLRQGLQIMDLMRDINVKHRDFIMTNTIVRFPPPGSQNYRMVVIDFGGSYADGVPGVVESHKAGRFFNHGRLDSFMLACGFHKEFYHSETYNDCRVSVPPSSTSDPSKLEHFLVEMMRLTFAHDANPDYNALIAKLDLVTSIV